MTDFMTLDEAREELRSMEADTSMKTISRYNPVTTEWPDHMVPFREVHMAYLRKNKAVNPAHYISNLKLMIKIR